MSFSQDLKAELADVMPKARHCQISELEAVLEIAGRPFFNRETGKTGFRIRTENSDLVRKVFTIADKAFKIGNEFAKGAGAPQRDRRDAEFLIDSDHLIRRLTKAFADNGTEGRTCCRRAYLRGAYLAGGTISDPNRYYHLEIVCPDVYTADKLIRFLRGFDLNAKAVERKGMQVVYLKEADQIAEMLRLTGANRTLMDFENIRIMREMRGSVNRQVNCETANLRKTVDAALRQIEDIQYLRKTGALNQLPPALRRTAEMRIAYPEASLTELGNLLTPKVGKSGINHRLRKLQELAWDLREKNSQ